MEEKEAAAGIDQAPYAKVTRWMTEGLKLRDESLLAFALIYERDHPSGPDSSRIDSGYIIEACDIDDDELGDLYQRLRQRGIVRFAHVPGSMGWEPKVSDDGVRARLEESAREAEKKTSK